MSLSITLLLEEVFTGCLIFSIDPLVWNREGSKPEDYYEDFSKTQQYPVSWSAYRFNQVVLWVICWQMQAPFILV